ncbi:hypothetical protein SAMN05443270_1978 [Lacrimispora sphenoides]|jgi:hypothetical protein|uniref:hypothetical protein n=1 Tax=Lacrimispora sphenoides TaxID=29370 RepID=UPI0008D6A152|nr:hypothetical protein [Lacrimispora sphenoides]SET90775.1 hypothetical protein SAMN05443270_1978 [Lacrimispora sphenoides]
MAETTNNNKMRLLRLFRYLYVCTDEEQKVTTQQLHDILTENGYHGNRMTVKNYVDMLIDAGFDIIVSKEATNTFYYGTRIFEIPEIKLMIDAVPSSRFITADNSEKLIGKLAHLAGPSVEKKLIA